MGVIIKGQQEGSCGFKTAQYFNHNGGYTNLYVVKLYRTEHTHVNARARTHTRVHTKLRKSE